MNHIDLSLEITKKRNKLNQKGITNIWHIANSDNKYQLNACKCKEKHESDKPFLFYYDFCGGYISAFVSDKDPRIKTNFSIEKTTNILLDNLITELEEKENQVDNNMDFLLEINNSLKNKIDEQNQIINNLLDLNQIQLEKTNLGLTSKTSITHNKLSKFKIKR